MLASVVCRVTQRKTVQLGLRKRWINSPGENSDRSVKIHSSCLMEGGNSTQGGDEAGGVGNMGKGRGPSGPPRSRWLVKRRGGD